jgi:hypothetical protein
MRKHQNYEKLVAEFVAASEKSAQALVIGDSKVNNKWVKKQVKVFKQIVSIGDIARDELVRLLDAENLDIALSAAVFSLKYSTEKSLTTLKKIAQEPGLLGFRAQQAIQRWEEGSWQIE